MTINLVDYEEQLENARINISEQIRKMRKLNNPLYKYKDNSNIKWSSSQKKKVEIERQDYVIELEAIIVLIKQSLNM